MHNILHISRGWRDVTRLNEEKGKRRGWQKRVSERLLKNSVKISNLAFCEQITNLAFREGKKTI